MQNTEPIGKLLFQQEILRAKLELKDYLLESVVRDIYEQTGQVLSLARFRLATVESHIDDRSRAVISEATTLVGDAISGLRNMGRNLFPENELMTEEGFLRLMPQALQMDTEKLEVSGTPSTLDQDAGVILLATLVNLISMVRKLSVKGTLEIRMQYTEDHLLIHLLYQGDPIDFDADQLIGNASGAGNLTIQQRLALIHANIIRKPAPDQFVGYQIMVPLSGSDPKSLDSNDAL